MLVIALSRLSVLPHLHLLYLTMTAHMSRRGGDGSYSIAACSIDGDRSQRKGSMSLNTIRMDFAGVIVKVQANRLQGYLNKVQASVIIRQLMRLIIRIKYIYLSKRIIASQLTSKSSHAGSALSVKTSSAVAGISLSPRARSCKMTKSKETRKIA